MHFSCCLPSAIFMNDVCNDLDIASHKIAEMENPNHRIRDLVQRRIVDFAKQAISASRTAPLQVSFLPFAYRVGLKGCPWVVWIPLIWLTLALEHGFTQPRYPMARLIHVLKNGSNFRLYPQLWFPLLGSPGLDPVPEGAGSDCRELCPARQLQPGRLRGVLLRDHREPCPIQEGRRREERILDIWEDPEI